MRTRESWTFTLQSRCPKYKEDVSFRGTVAQNPTDVVLDSCCVVIAMGFGIPMFTLPTPLSTQVLGGCLLVLAGWKALTMLARRLHL